MAIIGYLARLSSALTGIRGELIAKKTNRTNCSSAAAAGMLPTTECAQVRVKLGDERIAVASSVCVPELARRSSSFTLRNDPFGHKFETF